MKVFKSRLFIFILGVIISSSITALAVIKVDSEEVIYHDDNNVKDALDDLYNSYLEVHSDYQTLQTNYTNLQTTYNNLSNLSNSTTATAQDILFGKTAYSKGQLVTGTYKTPAMYVTFQVGSHGSAETLHQTRLNMASYSGVYKYFKITTINCETSGLCGNLYFNSQCDQGSANVFANTEYETKNYPGLTMYTTGAKSYYYTVVISLYN